MSAGQPTKLHWSIQPSDQAPDVRQEEVLHAVSLTEVCRPPVLRIGSNNVRLSPETAVTSISLAALNYRSS